MYFGGYYLDVWFLDEQGFWGTRGVWVTPRAFALKSQEMASFPVCLY